MSRAPPEVTVTDPSGMLSALSMISELIWLWYWPLMRNRFSDGICWAAVLVESYNGWKTTVWMSDSA